MVDVNATRLCVVCGVMFVRDGKRIFCSNECKKTREAQVKRQSAILHGHINGEQSLTCKHCSVQFVGPSNKVYCTQRCKDRARPAPKQPRKKSRNESQRARDNEVKRLRRKTEDRSAEFERAKQKRRDAMALRVRRLGHSAPSDEALARRKEKAYQTAHALALRMDVARDAAIAKKAAKQAKADAKAKAKANGAPSEYVEWLRRNPDTHARYIAKWRAKSFKRKTGRVMPNDHTANGVVMFGAPRCLYCNCKLTWENRRSDHMTPLVLGGVHSAANIAPACIDCNGKKGGMDFAQWVTLLLPADRVRAVRFFEKRNGPMQQVGLRLAC